MKTTCMKKALVLTLIACITVETFPAVALGEELVGIDYNVEDISDREENFFEEGVSIAEEIQEEYTDDAQMDDSEDGNTVFLNDEVIEEYTESDLPDDDILGIEDIAIEEMANEIVLSAADTVDSGADEEDVTRALNVDYHTKEEIVSFISNHLAPEKENWFSIEPSVEKPYSCGKLTDNSLRYGINALNQMRYIAGIPADVILNQEYSQKAQAAALISFVNAQLSHFPSKPKDMDEETFQLCYDGASKSNLAYCRASLASSVSVWMHDSGSTNIDHLGHRRWMLDPKMKEIGFGAVYCYSAAYVVDRSRNVDGYTEVAWPAQNMPLEYFSEDHAWNISFQKIDPTSDIQVDLKRKRDGKTWHFSRATSNGHFNVSTVGYGMPYSVIFQPKGIAYRNGDHFDVTIKGVYDVPLVYSVDFFSICNGKHHYKETITREATTEKSGKKTFLCTVCGDFYFDIIPKLVKLKKPTILNPSATNNKIIVKWSHFKHSTKEARKIWNTIKKVQVQCSTDKKFKNIVKTLSVSKNKTKAVVRGLKKNTKYYIRIRYTGSNSNSGWSSIKKIRTKKK